VTEPTTEPAEFAARLAALEYAFVHLDGGSLPNERRHAMAWCLAYELAPGWHPQPDQIIALARESVASQADFMAKFGINPADIGTPAEWVKRDFFRLRIDPADAKVAVMSLASARWQDFAPRGPA